MNARTKAIRNVGLAGLAALFIINLTLRLVFKHIFPQFFAEDWWFEWFPFYIAWIALVGILFRVGEQGS